MAMLVYQRVPGIDGEKSRLEDTNGVFNLGNQKTGCKLSLSGLILQGARMGRHEIHQTG